MRILFYFGHPAQYHSFRLVIRELRVEGHAVTLLIKKKDILEELMKEYGEEYHNILPEGRKNSPLGILFGLIKRDVRLFRFMRRKKFDILIGSDPSLSHIGWLKGIPVLTFLEDDYGVIRKLADITYPFSTYIVTPGVVDVGKYIKKKIGYDGYMKLAYLHPKWLAEEFNRISEPYYLVRLSGLKAYHDKGISGIDEELLDEILLLLKSRGKILISSELDLPAKYNDYKLISGKNEIHSFLASSALFISDSQSMSVEAAILGVPSIRISGLKGRLSVLEELEYKYQLTFGFSPDEKMKMFITLNDLLSISDLKDTFRKRKEKMLSEKIDVKSFFLWLIHNYPDSTDIMVNNSGFQYFFR